MKQKTNLKAGLISVLSGNEILKNFELNVLSNQIGVKKDYGRVTVKN